MKIYTAFLIFLVIFKNSYGSPVDETNNKIKLFKEEQTQFKTYLNEIITAKKNQWTAYCNYQTTSYRKKERMEGSILYGLAIPTAAYIPAIILENELLRKTKPSFWLHFLEAFVDRGILPWVLIGVFTGAAFSTLKTLNYQLWAKPKKEFLSSFDEIIHYEEVLAKTNYELDTAKSKLKKHIKEYL
ncbi:MAG: hypothetical protein AB7R69_02410 [Candidatus Babeliales bacterium]